MSESQYIGRFLKKVQVLDNGCWQWIAAISYVGYGVFSIRHKCVYAHRCIYEYYYNKLDPKLQIHHMCRNRRCCNPLHLKLITQKENLLKGNGVSAINARKTHCIHGHPYTKKNTWFNKKNGRVCRACAKIYRQKVHGKINA